MKRITLLIASCWIAVAAMGCGVDYGAIINDAHDMHSGAQHVIDAKCGTSAPTDGCVKLQEASTVLTDLLQIADFALTTGTDLESSAKTAWSYAELLAKSVKALFGIKAVPPLSTASAVTLPPGAFVGPVEVAKP